MNFKPFLIVSLLIAFFSSNLLAQGHFCHPAPFEFTDEIKTLLDLSPEQASQLNQFQEDIQKQMEEVHQNTDLNSEELQTLRKAIIEEKRSTVRTILTKQQRQQLRQYQQKKARIYKEAWANVDQKAMHKEMKQYHRDNIKPVIQVQRQKLDSNLSTEEKTNLEKIREQVRITRKNRSTEGAGKSDVQGYQRAHRQNFAHNGKEHGHHFRQMPPPPYQQLDKLMGWLKHNPNAYATLQQIITNHQTQIDLLLEEIAPEQAQWKADQSAIFEEYASEVIALRLNSPKNRDDKLCTLHEAKRKEAQIMQFLLNIQKQKKPSTSREGLKLNVYPNPVTTTTTVSFELKDATPLSILLTNEKGYTIKTIPAQEYNKGQNNVELDLSSLPNGTYSLVLKGTLGTPSVLKVIVLK